MKKLILFVLLCISLTAFAQPKYSGDIRYIEDRSPSWIGIDATCNVSIFVESTTSGPHFRYSLNGIEVNHLKIKGTFYSSSQLPANVINAIKENARIQVSFNLYDGDINIKKLDGASHISWDELLRLPASEHYKQSTTDAGVKLYNSGRLNIRNVKITSLSYTSSELQDFIDEKSSPVKAPAKSASNSANNSVREVSVVMPDSKMTTPSADVSGESTETDNSDSEIDAPNTSADDTSTDYTPISYTTTPTKTEVYVQATATIVGSLVDEMNANYDKKMARLQAESDARLRNSVARETARFESYYYPLINLANSGNVDAQIILYMESDNFLRDKVPHRDEWIKQALADNNVTAILIVANMVSFKRRNFYPDYSSAYKEYKEGLELAANLGSVDAMVMLGQWYSQKNNKMRHFYNSNIYGTVQDQLQGGGNQEKALKYFTAAAEKGSPNAMFCLGMIYKYGRIVDDSYLIKFDVEKDEKLAFEWFTKSIMPDYKESIYQRHHVQKAYWEGSYFKPSAYGELAIMYRQGKVVPKDLAKATELERLQAERIIRNKKLYGGN